MIRLIALDFDGTLLTHHPDGRFVAERTRELLATACAQGVEAGIVTGNTWWHVRKVLAGCGVDWDGLFPSYVISNENFIHRKVNGRMQPDAEWNTAISQAMGRLTSWLAGFYYEVYPELEELGIPFGCNLTGDYGMLVGSPDGEEAAERIRVWLTERVRDVPYARVHRNRGNSNIVLSHSHLGPAGKGASLWRLAQSMGIQADEVLAVGDGLNDLDMLDETYGFHCGTPGDAADVVKDVVLRREGFVAEQPSSEGLAQILAHFLCVSGKGEERGGGDV